MATDGLLACFGKRRKSAITKYMDFIRAGVGLESIWTHMSHPTSWVMNPSLRKLAKATASNKTVI